MTKFLNDKYPDEDVIYKQFLASDFGDPSFKYAKEEFVTSEFAVDFIMDQLEMWLFGTVEEHVEFIEFDEWFLSYDKELREKIVKDLL